MNEPKIIAKRTALFLLLAITLLGGYVRILDLGKYSFWEDEFLHVFAAKGILQSGQPLLPSGIPYTRSLLYTYIVTIFFKLFGVSEITARMPSALLGMFTIPLLYYVVSKLLNRNIALISVLLLAFSPFCIAWTKICRMYSLFQPLYLLSAFYFFKAFEDKNDKNTQLNFSFRHIKNYIAFFVIFSVSFLVHDQSLFLAPTIVTFYLSMLIFVYFKSGWRPALHSRYFKLVIFAILMVVGGALCNAYFLKNDFSAFTAAAPVWAQKNAHYTHFYHWIIQDSYPVFTYLFPLTLLALIIKKQKIGLYIATCFLVPLSTLSFIFTWKDDRYMFFIFPFFIIVSSFFIEQALYFCWKFFYAAALALFPANIANRKTKCAYTISSLSLLFILYPIVFPWIKVKPEIHMNFGIYDFHKFGSFASKIDKKDILVCTEPFLIEYYSSRKADFMIKTYEFAEKSRNSPPLLNEKGEETDPHNGIRLINSLSELKSLENSQGKIWIITNAYLFDSPSLEKDIREHVKANYIKHPISGRTYEIYYK